jgi:AcrR family transcriptional regulator
MPPKAGLDHAAVVQAAAALADTAEIGQFTLADLAAQLGVRTPSLYNHVAGLPGLRRDLALLGTRELYARLSRAAIGKSGDAAVQALCQAYRTFVNERPGLYAATVRSALLADQPNPELNAAQQDTVDVVLMVLSAYQLSGADAIHAAAQANRAAANDQRIVAVAHRPTAASRTAISAPGLSIRAATVAP